MRDSFATARCSLLRVQDLLLETQTLPALGCNNWIVLEFGLLSSSAP
jgi:hypothetical protein